MKPLKTLTLLCSLAVGAVWAQNYSTSFPLTENPISERGRWLNSAANGGINMRSTGGSPGYAYGTGNSGTDSGAVLTGTWNPNHIAYATVHLPNPARGCCEEIEVRLRMYLSNNPCPDNTADPPIYQHQTTGPCQITYNVAASIVPGAHYVNSGLAYGPSGNVCISPNYNQPCYDPSPGLGNANCSDKFPDKVTSVCTFAEGDVLTASISGTPGTGGNVVTVWHTQHTTGQKVQLFTYSDNRSWAPTTGNPGMGVYFQNGNSQAESGYGISRFTASGGQQTPEPPTGLRATVQ